MVKVYFFDKRLLKQFYAYASAIFSILSGILIFTKIPEEIKLIAGGIALTVLVGLYIFLWWHSNTMKAVDLEIDGSTVTVKSGDIFNEPGLKAIAFNEYFDTHVDEKLISSRSLNGIFINKFFPKSVDSLDSYINEYEFENGEVLGENSTRKTGKKLKYALGTICVYDEYILTAFSKFDESNKAMLTMPEYLEFLIKFWDKVNKVYAQRDVAVPIFGSGITRFKEHKNICDEELLKIMLWTFRISEMRFKYPAKLTIIVHTDKINLVNLFEIKSARNGL